MGTAGVPIQGVGGSGWPQGSEVQIQGFSRVFKGSQGSNSRVLLTEVAHNNANFTIFGGTKVHVDLAKRRAGADPRCRFIQKMRFYVFFLFGQRFVGELFSRNSIIRTGRQVLHIDRRYSSLIRSVTKTCLLLACLRCSYAKRQKFLLLRSLARENERAKSLSCSSVHVLCQME